MTGFLIRSKLPGSTSLLLDQFPGATVLLSLKKESSAYAGHAIRVSHSAGTSPVDIDFVGNELDSATLDPIIANSATFIDIIYDQSGNTNNATQTTLSKRWKIIKDIDGNYTALSNYVQSSNTAATTGMVVADNASHKTTVIDLYTVCKIGTTNADGTNYVQVAAAWTAASSTAESASRWGLLFSEGGFADGLELPRNASQNTYYSPSLPSTIPLGGTYRENFHTYHYNSSANRFDRNTVNLWNDGGSTNVTYTGTGQIVLGQNNSGTQNSNGAFRTFVIYGTTQGSSSSIQSYLMSRWGTAENPTSWNSGDGWLWTPDSETSFVPDSVADANGMTWDRQFGGYADNGTRGPSFAYASNVNNGALLVRAAVGPYDSDTIVTGQERAERAGNLGTTPTPIVPGNHFERFGQVWIEPGSVQQGDWAMIFQNHYGFESDGGGSSPDLCFISLKGTAAGFGNGSDAFLTVTQRNGTDTGQGSSLNFTRGVWYAIRISGFWSVGGTTDTLQVWIGLNGSTLTQICNASGSLFSTDTTHAYPKQGIYRGYPNANAGNLAVRFANEMFSFTNGAYSSYVTTQPSLPTHP